MTLRGKHRRRTRGRASEFQVVARAMAPLLESLRTGGEVGPTAARVAAAYAARQESLDTYLRDLDACLDAGGLPPATSAMLRETSTAWADAFAARYLHVGCDHQSGLASVHHLQGHVKRLLSDGVSPDRDADGTRYALLVVELPAKHATAERMALVNDELRVRATGLDILAALTPRRSGVLVRRTPTLCAKASTIDTLIAKRTGIWSHNSKARVWVEGVPENSWAAAGLLDELAR